jgi:aldehyde dehydrogenase (NAD+)
MKAQVLPSVDIVSVFNQQKAYQYTQRITTARERIDQLRKLQKGLGTIQYELIEAMSKDLERPVFETVVFEHLGLIKIIDETCENLEKWMEPEIKPSSIKSDANIEIRYESRGVVLIIGPWNFPFLLVLEPLVAAIAAGNTVIAKPSEMTPNVSKVVKNLISSVFEPKFVAVIEGGIPETTELLALPFDHIFFTGSPTIGKIVMAAAAKNLTSVTLELGGKNPFIVDAGANLEKAAQTLIHKTTINAGQLCLSPDYGLIHHSQVTQFVALARKAIKKMYYSEGKYAEQDSSKIINQKNYDRLKSLFGDAVEKGATIVAGGIFDDQKLRIEPTLLTKVAPNSKILEEEIFGPIFPILTYDTIWEAIEYVNSKPKPLALYLFSDIEENTENVIKMTSSGGVCINEAFVHALDYRLPFGGVNNSGVGSYHGKFGFMELSHAKSIFYDQSKEADTMMAPPFEGKLEQLTNAQ